MDLYISHTESVNLSNRTLENIIYAKSKLEYFMILEKKPLMIE